MSSYSRLQRWYATGIKGDKWFGEPMPDLGPVDASMLADNPYLSSTATKFGAKLTKREDGWFANHVRVPDELQADVEAIVCEARR